MTDTLQVLADAGFDVTDAVVEPLAGGISCVTERVRVRDQDLVVKRALGRLLVDDDWRASPDRTVAEGFGLAWFHSRTPLVVPKPIRVIEQPPTLVLPMAAQPCLDWRARLLADPTPADIMIAAQLRAVLDDWRLATVDDARGTPLDDLSRVTELRIEPFYLQTARRFPQFRTVIEACAAELREQRSMVHGDFTPKNVLCLSDGIWVIDTEITHIGNPILDAAAMTAHLVLKSVVHRVDPARSQAMQRIREAFAAERIPDAASLPAHVGVHLAVRAGGISPARYLDDASITVVSGLSRMLLSGAALDDVEEALESAT